MFQPRPCATRAPSPQDGARIKHALSSVTPPPLLSPRLRHSSVRRPPPVLSSRAFPFPFRCHPRLASSVSSAIIEDKHYYNHNVRRVMLIIMILCNLGFWCATDTRILERSLPIPDYKATVFFCERQTRTITFRLCAPLLLSLAPPTHPPTHT